MSPARVARPMERRASRVDTGPLEAAMARMQIPLRRVRQGFRTRRLANGRRYGTEFWRDVDGARVGGFIGFLTDPRGWEHIRLEIPEAVVLGFVRPLGHPVHKRLVARKGSFYEKVARRSAYEAVRFDFFRDREDALVRHRSMADRPDEILVLSACDFFMTSFRAFWASEFLDKLMKMGTPKRRTTF